MLQQQANVSNKQVSLRLLSRRTSFSLETGTVYVAVASRGHSVVFNQLYLVAPNKPCENN